MDEEDDEEESDTYLHEPDLTTAFEMDSLEAVVHDLEERPHVQDLEDLRELSLCMYEGLVSIKEPHVNEDEHRGSRESSSSWLAHRYSGNSPRGRGRGGDANLCTENLLTSNHLSGSHVLVGCRNSHFQKHVGSVVSVEIERLAKLPTRSGPTWSDSFVRPSQHVTPLVLFDRALTAKMVALFSPEGVVMSPNMRQCRKVWVHSPCKHPRNFTTLQIPPL